MSRAPAAVAYLLVAVIAVLALGLVTAAFVMKDEPPQTPEMLREDPRRNRPIKDNQDLGAFE